MLRGRFKVYLADAAIAPAVWLKGKSAIEDPGAVDVATETAVFKHLYARYYARQVKFTYWRGKQNHEVDLVAQLGETLIPFEVKYREERAGAGHLKGLLEFCRSRNVERGYVVTRSLSDFGAIPGLDGVPARVLRVPATLLCYWMGEAEVHDA